MADTVKSYFIVTEGEVRNPYKVKGDLKLAKKNAENFARDQPGQEFFIYKLVGVCSTRVTEPKFSRVVDLKRQGKG